MRVLVAGGTGALGRQAVPRLLDGGHEVVAVSRSEASDRQLTEVGAKPVRLDVFDAEAAKALAASHDVEVVANLATSIPVGNAALRMGAWKTNSRLRRDASRALAMAANDVGARFVQESFAPTYPDRGDAWIDEDVPLEPYAQTMTVPDAEASARSLTAAGGTGVVLRFGLFYGAGASAQLLAMARRGRLMLPGRPTGYVSMIHLDDAGAAVVAALSVPAGTYNVVEDEPATRAEHAEILGELLDQSRVRLLPGLLSRLRLLRVLSRSHRIANGRLKAVSDWAPAYPAPRVGWQQIVQESVGRQA